MLVRRALCRRHTLPTIAPRAFCSPSPSKLARAVATHVSRCIADSTAAKLSLCHAQGPSSHSFHLSLSLYIGTCSLLVKKNKKKGLRSVAATLCHYGTQCTCFHVTRYTCRHGTISTCFQVTISTCHHGTSSPCSTLHTTVVALTLQSATQGPQASGLQVCGPKFWIGV